MNAASVMIMSRSRQAPEIAHLRHVQQTFGYLTNLPHEAIRYRPHEPNYSKLLHKVYDWARTVYAGAREEKPHNLSKALGKSVTSTHCVMQTSTMTW